MHMNLMFFPPRFLIIVIASIAEPPVANIGSHKTIVRSSILLGSLQKYSCGSNVSSSLKDGGVAIMSYGIDKGEQRLAGAFDKALHSPLLNNNNIYDSKKILFNIYIEPEEDEDDEAGLRVGEMEWVNNFMKRFNHDNIEVIWGMSEDETLQKGEVKVTVLATGFGMHNIPEMRPILKEDEKQKETEERNIQNMMDSFYKEEYKVYLMSDTDLDNDELISYMENSPTHKRMSRDIQNMKNISQASTNNHE